GPVLLLLGDDRVRSLTDLDDLIRRLFRLTVRLTGDQGRDEQHAMRHASPPFLPPNDPAQQPGPQRTATHSRKRTGGPGLLQRLTCYREAMSGARPGGRINRMQRMRPRPREPGGGPAAGALDLGCQLGARPRIREPEGRDAVGTASTATHFAGIDVSKDARDAGLLGPSGATRTKRLANDPKGHAALLAGADRHAGGGPTPSCREAPGPSPEPTAPSPAAAGRLVSVATPAWVRAHAESAGQANKTDPADARAIAESARDRQPRP